MGFLFVFCPWVFNKAILHKTAIQMYELGYEGQLCAYYKDAKVYLTHTYPAVEIPLVNKVQILITLPELRRQFLMLAGTVMKN